MKMTPMMLASALFHPFSILDVVVICTVMACDINGILLDRDPGINRACITA